MDIIAAADRCYYRCHHHHLSSSPKQPYMVTRLSCCGAKYWNTQHWLQNHQLIYLRSFHLSLGLSINSSIVCFIITPVDKSCHKFSCPCSPCGGGPVQTDLVSLANERLLRSNQQSWLEFADNRTGVEIGATLFESISLGCLAVGSSKPTIYWLKDGEVIRVRF